MHVEAGGGRVDATAETLLIFAPRQRHGVRGEDGAQVMLILSDRPGEGQCPAAQPAEEMID